MEAAEHPSISTINDPNYLQDGIDPKHPYKNELLNFVYPQHQLTETLQKEPPKSISQTPLVVIDTLPALENLVDILASEEVLGIDIEYSDHGYVGLTCIIQISTRSTDYLVDTIALKNETPMLATIFANPLIVKVYHASANDLKWLQQDFRIFNINIFDTQIALKALGVVKLGLSTLLKERYGIVKNDSLQRADFRKRPLPDSYKEYARTDSHYLIDLYHSLKNELIEANLLKVVLEECKKCCEMIHNDSEDTYDSVLEYIKGFQERQLMVLRKLNEWRHDVAKRLDKSPGVVLSKAALKDLVLQLPQEHLEVMALSKSKFVKEDLSKVVKILRGAKYSQNSLGQDIKPNYIGPNQRGHKRNYEGRGGSYHHHEHRPPPKRGRYDPFRGSYSMPPKRGRNDSYRGNFRNFHNQNLYRRY